MAHVPQAVSLRRISTHQAAQAFTACAGLDPEGRATPESAAMAGECYAVAGPGGEVSVSVAFNQGRAWIMAAAGGGDRMAAPTLQTLEHLARAHACREIAFQTMRAGLRRVALRLGYTETEKLGAGWRLAKKL